MGPNEHGNKNRTTANLHWLFGSAWLHPFVMNDYDSIAERRTATLHRVFPDGVPSLWCPLLTHYDREGRIDMTRMTAHLAHLAVHVKGFLIPGSTGDGWELTDAEFRQLLEIAFEQVEKLNLNLLIGILKPDAKDAAVTVREITDLIK